MREDGAFTLPVSEADHGTRLDLFVSLHMEGCSRSHAGHLIREGHVRVDGTRRKPAYRVCAGESVHGVLPSPAPSVHRPEPMALAVCYEDEHLLAVDKPPGLVVHPAPGHEAGTLVNGVLHRCPELEGIGSRLRPGIVHRLDKDTSGLILVAKSAPAYLALSRQFQERSVSKTYLGLVSGHPPGEAGTMDRPISRHPVERKRMTARNPGGRNAITLWRLLESLPVAALLAFDLRTGRTHQIRVHCAEEGFPLVGDAVYGQRRLKSWRRGAERRHETLRGHLEVRQMLHAWRLRFAHPVVGGEISLEAPPPPDFVELLGRLRGIAEARGA